MYPRLQRKRSRTSVRPMRYTGFSPRPPRREPRSAMGVAPTSSATTLPEQPEQPTGILGLVAAKKAYDNIGDMYDSGQKAREGILGLPEKMGNAWDKVSDYLPDIDFGGGSDQMASQVSMPMSSYGDFTVGDSGNITSLMGDPVGATSPYAGGEVSGLLGDSTGGTESVSGMDGGGTPWLSYANIAKDLAMGSDKLTGNEWGDAAIRVPLAYATGGLSELGYAFGDMLELW